MFMNLALPFADSRCEQPQLSGGKGVNLARLTRAQFPVPPGFIVTTHAYRRFIADNGLATPIAVLLASINYADADSLEAVTARIRACVVGGALGAALQEQIAAQYAKLGDQPFVAVRSSGTAEDLASASFAGQHDTYLDIRAAAQVNDAVKRCWASLWTGRAVAYRQRKGLGHDVGIAVVVQTMIAAEVSGVVFTANPMTAAVDEYVVNASWGLGEAIVAGLVTPDMFVLDRGSKQVIRRTHGHKARRIERDPDLPHGTREVHVPDADADRACLDEVQLAELGLLAARVSKYYEDYPQDIEWCLADGKFHLLQSRDITGVDFSWDEDLDSFQTVPKRADQVWTRSWADAVWTGAISPLFYSYRAQLAQGYRRKARELWGLEAYDATRIFKFHKSFVYYSSKVDYTALSTILPPSMRKPAMLENLPPRWQKDIVKEPHSWTWIAQAIERIGMLRPERLPWTIFPEFYRRFHSEAELAHGASDAELLAMNDDALKKFAQRSIDGEGDWVEFHWTVFWLYAPLATGILTYMIEQWLGDDDPATAADLLTGLPRASATMIENERLGGLAREIAASPKLMTLFAAHPGAAFFDQLDSDAETRAFRDRYRAFQNAYRHRGHADRDIYFDRRGDNPGLDYTSLKVMMTADSAAAEEKARAVVERRERRTADILAALRAQPLGEFRAAAFTLVHAWLLEFWVFRDDERFHNDRWNYAEKRAFAEIGRRLIERGLLHEKDDHYFFSKTELFEMLDTGSFTRLHAAKLRGRRRNHARYRREFTPPRYMVGEQYADLDAAASADTANLLKGVGTSRGTATGVARVIASQMDIGRVQKDDILVTIATDPGWTPVFAVIAGLVLETGGMLAHGACISREYGIPAVQAANAMARIKDGDRITVDGDTGQVTIEHAIGDGVAT
jgi:pyruvate,water dikinase